jgi:hypothetical protein
VVLIDWGVFWGAVGAIAAIVGIGVAVWLGLRRRSFGLRSEAVLDTPRRAIRVTLTARGPGEVKGVKVVYGPNHTTYPTTAAPDKHNPVPFKFPESGGKLYLTLRPTGDDPARTFGDDTSKKLKVYVDTSRKPGLISRKLRLIISIRSDQNVVWTDPVS